MKFAQISLLKMSITRNSRKFLELKLYGAKVVFAQNDSAKKKFAEISCMEITLLKMLRSNFCESAQSWAQLHSIHFVQKKLLHKSTTASEYTLRATT